VVDCLHNIHPIYAIKRLMIMRELEKDPALKNESWDKYLPKFKRINTAKQKAAKKKKKLRKPEKEYTPFPPPIMPRAIDEKLATGEYFFTKTAENKRIRDLKFIPPEETDAANKAPRQLPQLSSTEESVSKIKKQLQKKSEKSSGSVDDYLLRPKKKKRSDV